MEKIKVIIADDSDFVRDGMKIILDVDDEFEVIGVAASGREAIEIAEKDSPDIFLMDIQMPDMDGVETAKAIRTEIGDESAIIILTAYHWDEIFEEAENRLHAQKAVMVYLMR